ncbi:MAG TPA: hypothetical protein VFJ45_12375 [bacterium]|nr:hypothetical protein [bacterium]
MRKGAGIDVGDTIRGLRQSGAWGAFQRGRKRNVDPVLEHLRRWGLLE